MNETYLLDNRWYAFVFFLFEIILRFAVMPSSRLAGFVTVTCTKFYAYFLLLHLIKSVFFLIKDGVVQFYAHF